MGETRVNATPLFLFSGEPMAGKAGPHAASLDVAITNSLQQAPWKLQEALRSLAISSAMIMISNGSPGLQSAIVHGG